MATQYTNSVSYLRTQQWLDAERLGYINEIFYGASPMGMIPIVPASGFMRDETMIRGHQTTKLTQKRKLNEEPPAKSGNPFKKLTEETAIYARRTDIDYRLAEHRPEVYDEMLKADAMELVLDIDYDIFNGTPDATGYGFEGLVTRIPTGHGQDVNNSAALTVNTNATTFKTFLRLFREAKDLVKLGPGMQLVAYCNKGLKRAISSGRDELGANVAGFGYMDILNNRVMTVDDVPLIALEQDSVGNEILPFTEGSTGENSTSLWIVGIGGGPNEGSKDVSGGLVILSSDEVIRIQTDRGLTQIQSMQEIDVGVRVPPRSVARVSRLKTV